MCISRKTDYALRMLSMLAEDESRILSARTAAEEVDVPYSFARSIQRCLVEAGLVESVRGVNGGMRLKANPKVLTIRQIVEAVQGPLLLNDDCTGNSTACSQVETCCYHSLWMGLQEVVYSYLDSVTLDDVVNRRSYPAVDPMFAEQERFPEYTGRAEAARLARAIPVTDETTVAGEDDGA